MTPYCTACDRFMRCETNSVTVVSGAAYSGDLFACPECHTGVVVGFGRNPYEMDPDKIVELRRKAAGQYWFTEAQPVPRSRTR